MEENGKQRVRDSALLKEKVHTYIHSIMGRVILYHCLGMVCASSFGCTNGCIQFPWSIMGEAIYVGRTFMVHYDDCHPVRRFPAHITHKIGQNTVVALAAFIHRSFCDDDLPAKLV